MLDQVHTMSTGGALPATYSRTVMDDRRMIHIVGRGQADASSCIQAVREQASHPAHMPEYKILLDIRELDFHPDSMEAISLARTVVDLRKKFQGKIAVVVCDKVQMFAAQLVGRLVSAGGISMMPFADVESAVRF
jgi:hypothetical protein